MLEAVITGVVGGLIGAGCVAGAQVLILKWSGLALRQRKAKKLKSNASQDRQLEVVREQLVAQQKSSAAS